jgi:hypothetical protein
VAFTGGGIAWLGFGGGVGVGRAPLPMPPPKNGSGMASAVERKIEKKKRRGSSL